MSRPRDVGLRSGGHGTTGGRARDHARAGGSAPRPHGSRPTLSAGRTVDPPIEEAPATSAGTATFLFTDIEGSTRLEQAVGTARYGAIRERHRDLLRAAFTAAGGTEEGTEGDSFFVTFDNARAAVAAAVAAQRSIAAEAWDGGVEVRVRMGLHTGE